MKLTEAANIIQKANGAHLDKIYIPSIGREVFFYPLLTSDVKTLTRINLFDDFDIQVEALKLGLFDKLCSEDISNDAIISDIDDIPEEEASLRTPTSPYPKLNSKTITQLDYLAFLIGIRQLLNNNINFKYTCVNPDCGESFEETIDLYEIFNEDILAFKRQTRYFEKIDEKTGNIWKFELTNFTMSDYLYYRYFLEKLKEKDKNNPEVIFERRFIRPILYIKNIWINDEIIEDWQDSLLPDKLLFWNKIPPEITLNTKDSDVLKDATIYNFIHNNFAEEKLFMKIKEMYTTCPHCGKKYGGVYDFDNFFIF
jgi:hypothetical protein